MNTVYPIHFEQPCRHAKHYLGFTTDLDARIAAGVARFEATLPAYATRSADVEAVESCPNLVISADRQREICLTCSLPDCVGIGNPQCPIRIEARRNWRQHAKESNQ